MNEWAEKRQKYSTRLNPVPQIPEKEFSVREKIGIQFPFKVFPFFLSFSLSHSVFLSLILPFSLPFFSIQGKCVCLFVDDDQVRKLLWNEVGIGKEGTDYQGMMKRTR